MKKWTIVLVLGLCQVVQAQTLVVLGTLQDGGSPHMACEKACCAVPKPNDFVSSLGVLHDNGALLFDATPDFVAQTNYLKQIFGKSSLSIFLTHAHMGHYVGLVHLGLEAANTKSTPVYALPKMRHFLSQQGPWDQLLRLQNIRLMPLEPQVAVSFSQGLEITPILVPHRDEYSETAGYYIKGANKTALYIPDIDKWSTWELDIRQLLTEVDYAFLDGTFFAAGEVARPMAEVPHPFISETSTLLETLSPEEKSKVIFIHLNHSNPARDPLFSGRQVLEKQGFRFAKFGEQYPLSN